jgi:hypothetical protein
MKLLSSLRCTAIFVFFLLLAASAFAQFEISPDHFDENAAVKKTPSIQKQQAQTNSTQQVTKKTNTSKMQPTAIHAEKPSPRKNAATTVAKGGQKARSQRTSSTTPTANAPSLKAQASPPHKE